jgi:hypothetical protein
MPLPDFKEGDHVEHMSGDTGRITKITDAVHVTYDRGKNYWKGEYDALWFRTYPEGLKKVPAPKWPQQTPGA